MNTNDLKNILINAGLDTRSTYDIQLFVDEVAKGHNPFVAAENAATNKFRTADGSGHEILNNYYDAILRAERSTPVPAAPKNRQDMTGRDMIDEFFSAWEKGIKK